MHHRPIAGHPVCFISGPVVECELTSGINTDNGRVMHCNMYSISRWTLPLVLSLVTMTILKWLVMNNHTHSWHNRKMKMKNVM